MVQPEAVKEDVGLPFLDFFFQLRDEGLEIGLRDLLDFYQGLEKGLANDLNHLFLLGRLCFVRKVGNYDLYYRTFQRYFRGIHLPPVAEGDPRLLQTKAFAEWLSEAFARGELSQGDIWRLSRDELIRRFWETVKEQSEAHHGGNRWVGTGGSSSFGHSGFAQEGIRVNGPSRSRSALHVFGDRRYVDYDSSQGLTGENMRQVLGQLRHMKRTGLATMLDMQATIDKTARNGGEIELVLTPEQRDRLRLLVFFDNGGSSMLPFVAITQLLFSKIRSSFRDYSAYYFHNTLFKNVYSDAQRRAPVPLAKILQQPSDTRVFVVGDACMAPEELVSPYGAQAWEDSDPEPSRCWLERLKARFQHMVWLNPIPQDQWNRVHGSWTLREIASLVHMEVLSLGGIQRAVDYLSQPAG